MKIIRQRGITLIGDRQLSYLQTIQTLLTTTEMGERLDKNKCVNFPSRHFTHN